MAGMFDDLIPGNQAPANPQGGLFDDLVPTAQPLSTGEYLKRKLTQGAAGAMQGGAILGGGLAGVLGLDNVRDSLFENAVGLGKFQQDQDIGTGTNDAAQSTGQRIGGAVVGAIPSIAAAIANPALAMVPMGMQSAGQSGNLISEGVDAGTAGKVFATDMAGNVAGTFLPPGVGKSMKAIVPTSVAMNVGQNVATEAAKKQILENANYQQQAAQIDPLSLEQNLVAGLMGAGVGVHKSIPIMKQAKIDRAAAQQAAAEAQARQAKVDTVASSVVHPNKSIADIITETTGAPPSKPIQAEREMSPAEWQMANKAAIEAAAKQKAADEAAYKKQQTQYEQTFKDVDLPPWMREQPVTPEVVQKPVVQEVQPEVVARTGDQMPPAPEVPKQPEPVAKPVESVVAKSAFEAEYETAKAAGDNAKMRELAPKINAERHAAESVKPKPVEVESAPLPDVTEAGNRVVGKIGKSPKAAEHVWLRDEGDGTATVMQGKYEAADFESSAPVKVRSDASVADVQKAMTDAGAVEGQKWFGVGKKEELPEYLGGKQKAYDVGAYVGEHVTDTAKLVGDKVRAILGDKPIEKVKAVAKQGRANLQDNMIYLKDAMAKVKGGVDEAADAPMAENLMHGRVGERIKEIDEGLFRELEDKYKTAYANKGVNSEDLNLYRYALHAPERDAAVASRNEKEGAGSGWNTEKHGTPEQFIERMRQDGKLDALKRLDETLDKVADFNLKTKLEYGLITKEQYDKFKQYKKYVPLKGDEFEEGSGSGGMSFKQHGATGRFDEAQNPVERLLEQAQMDIIRGEKNRVYQALGEFAGRHGDETGVAKLITKDDAGKWDGAPIKAVSDPNTGKVRYQIDPQFRQREDVIVYKDKDGNEAAVQVTGDNAKEIARAFKSLGPQQATFGAMVMNGIRNVNSVLRNLYTTYSPDFVLNNHMRDMQQAFFNAGIEIDLKTATKIWKDSVRGIFGGGIWENVRHGTENKEFAKWYKDMARHGGETAFTSPENIKTLQARWKTLERQADNSALQKTTDGVKSAFELISDLNTVAENGLRVSMYKHMVEMGASKDKAALAAKDFTTNFNRRGNWTKDINTAYMFFNAGVQSTERIARMVKNPKFKYAVAGIATLGAAMNEYNTLFAGQDEDGRSFKEKIDKETGGKFIYMVNPADGGKTYIKIAPIPYSLLPIYNTGVQIDDLIKGNVSAGKATMNVLKSVSEGWNPMGNAGSFAQTIAPTIIDPIVQAYENKNFRGQQIAKEPSQFGYQKPDSSNPMGKRTSDASKVIAQGLNAATGGNEFRKGSIDVSPDIIDHLVRQYSGGFGKAIMDTTDIVSKTVKGQEPELRKVPIARTMAGETRAAPYEDFKQARQDIEASIQERKAGVQTSNPRLAQLENQLTDVESFSREMQRRKKNIDASRLDDTVKEERIKQIDQQIESKMKRFLKRYYEYGGEKQ